jgi:hypothetical protein
VIVPDEVRATGAQERDDDLEGFLEPLVDVVLGQAEAVRSAPGVARSQAQDEPPAADLVDRRGGLGDDPGVAVEGGRDPRPDLDPGRHRRDRGRHRDAVPEAVDRALLGQAPHELVRAPHRVEADLLGANRHLSDLAPARRGGILAGAPGSEHDTDLERAQGILHGTTGVKASLCGHPRARAMG